LLDDVPAEVFAGLRRSIHSFRDNFRAPGFSRSKRREMQKVAHTSTTTAIRVMKCQCMREPARRSGSLLLRFALQN
jgi:hypothetical protein